MKKDNKPIVVKSVFSEKQTFEALIRSIVRKELASCESKRSSA